MLQTCGPRTQGNRSHGSSSCHLAGGTISPPGDPLQGKAITSLIACKRLRPEVHEFSCILCFTVGHLCQDICTCASETDL